MINSNPLYILIGVTSLLGSTLACSSFIHPLEGNDSTGEEGYAQKAPSEDYRDEHNPSMDSTCPGALDRILAHAAGIDDTYQETGEEHEGFSLATYFVNGDEISGLHLEEVSADLRIYQDDLAAHQEIWDTFITLIPLNARESILAEYSLMTDGVGNGLAVVTQTSADPARWALSVDVADTKDKLYLTYTFIHEFAHLLTLGPDQVKPSLAVFENPDDDHIYFAEAASCPDYFPGEGCSRPGSYINAFFAQFWADIHEEWQSLNLIENDRIYYEALDKFYDDHRDSFLTSYAVTNPEEDIAESFTFYILSPHPTGESIAEKKILFFYEYPELVGLREQIMDGICQINQ